jgi:hypothetical protein
VPGELGSLHDHGGQDWQPPLAVASGEDVLGDAVRLARDSLAGRLLAAYALGSLAHGGFSPLVSDVDVALILADPIRCSDDQLLVGVAEKVRAKGTSLHRRVSVFWGTQASLDGRTDGGRFPPLDRLCLLEHGRLLHGTDLRDGIPAPSREQLVVAGARFALDTLADRAVEHVRRPRLLVEAGMRWTTKIVLFPVRFLFTAATGREGTNEAAACHYLGRREAPGAKLVAAALEWRASVPRRDLALTMLKDELLPLYLHYLTDHAGRLDAYRNSDLAEAFRGWRARLLAT